MDKIKIVLVDDHILIRMGLVSAIRVENDMEIVAEAEDGEEAIRVCRLHQPNVIILDLRLPSADGLGLIPILRNEVANAQILVLSNYAGGDDITGAIRAGAAGYVVKGMPLENLLQAIRAVHAGQQYIPPEIATRLAGRIQSQLSERELEVLRLIARGGSNKEIGATLDISESTVKLHVGNILTKLGVADRTQAVVQALKRHLLQLE